MALQTYTGEMAGVLLGVDAEQQSDKGDQVTLHKRLKTNTHVNIGNNVSKQTHTRKYWK